jgi:tripartite ATP-independent transporter DctM subunit
MEPALIGFIGILLLFALITLGVPIGFGFLSVGFLGIVFLAGLDVAMSSLARIPFTWITQYVFTCVPLFIMMGLLMASTGTAKDLFDLGFKWVGRVRGGLAMGTTIGCAAFGAVSGSSTACAATMSTICHPEMKQKKYSDSLSLGSIAAGSGIGLMIPPSLAFIVYGIMSQESIGRLFLAGIIPGIIQTIAFMITIYIMVWMKPAHAPIMSEERLSWMEKIKSLIKMWPVVVLFVMVIGGIYLGWCTVSEAAAIGSAGAMIVALAQRRLTWENFKHSFIMSAGITAVITMVVVGAMIFTVFMTLSGLPQSLSQLLGHFQNPTIIVLVILLAYIPLGMVMDSVSMIVLTLPLYQPFLAASGVDMIWFGILVCMLIQIGAITPPIGLNIFTVKAVAKDVPMGAIFKGTIPFLIANIVVTGILFLFPWLSLVLPRLMMG